MIVLSVGLLIVGLIADYTIGKGRIAIAPSPTPTESPTASAVATTGWKTYTNTKYGYSFQYPSTGWTLHTRPDSDFDVEVEAENTELSNYLAINTYSGGTDVGMKYEGQSKVGYVTIAGNQITKYHDSNCACEPATYEALLSINNRIETYNFICATEATTCDKILSTFKFTP